MDSLRVTWFEQQFATLSLEIAAMDKRINQRIDDMEQLISSHGDAMTKLVSAEHDQVISAIDGLRDEVSRGEQLTVERLDAVKEKLGKQNAELQAKVQEIYTPSAPTDVVTPNPLA